MIRRPRRSLSILALALATLGSIGGGSATFAASAQESQARLDRDLRAGRPVVVHLVVALCDNLHQGIVPVPKAIGNGQDPRSNLYWGARFGVRTFLAREGGWKVLPGSLAQGGAVLERVVFFARLRRGATTVPVYLVADAWDGAEMRGAIETFLGYASGTRREEVSFRDGAETVRLAAGGSAHLVAFVGHNGLMDFQLAKLIPRAAQAPANSSLVLACASKPYFHRALQAAGSHPLLLTTGLMAPEAYTLDAALKTWIGNGSVAQVRETAAQAYQKYQKCGLRAARNLFWGE